MSEAATPAETKPTEPQAPEAGGTPTDASAATPAPEEKPAETPAEPAAPAAPSAPQGETVTLPKAEHDQLVRDASRTRRLQRANDRRGGSGHFSPESQAPATPPSQEELAEKARQEDEKAKTGLTRIALDPKYRALFDADPTLREMITNNPLAVLPIYADDAIDAQDAIELVTEAFDERLKGLKPAETPPAEEGKNPDGTPKTPATPPATPPAGGVNVNGDLPNKDAEDALKNPNTEHAVAGSLQARLKAMGGKSS